MDIFLDLTTHITMAQCKLTPHEFIQNAFSPMVAVMCSPLVDQICQKNNLSFIEMIQPFCKLNTEAHIREPSGALVPVRNLRITMLDVNSRPPQPTLARKFLNESVSLSSSERNTTMQVGGQTVDVPSSIPWYEAWRETFLQVQFPSDHEFTKHYVACVLVVSSAENNPPEMLQHMGQQLQQLQNVTPAKLPKWFSPTVLRYHVLLHDATDGDNSKVETSFNSISTAYGEANCFLLQVNSRPVSQGEDQNHLPDPWSQFLIRHLDNQELSDQDSSPRTPAEIGGVTAMPSRVITDGSCDGDSVEVARLTAPTVMSTLEVAQEAGENSSSPVTHHPLSPDTEPHNYFQPSSDKNHLTGNDMGTASSHINANVWAGQSSAHTSVQHGACLTTTDLDRLRTLVQEFCIKALLPHVEKQIQQLSDFISNKKGVSRSLFSATKRWFGSNKPGLPGSNTPVNAVIYSSDAAELQLRRLGDLCFMFGHYSLAFQAFHSAKRDFSADQAWLYYAGALEMASLSAFMQGEMSRKAQDYMEESIVTYLNSCKMPQFATRATLLSTECLKGRSLSGEAAKQFIRMTSEDSDLRSALLLEQASYCFLKAARPRMTRKYAFHIVLAGHRFSKAGQRKHSLRCYRQAYQVYENKSWSLAEDHIHFTIGRQATNLKQVSEAAQAFSQLLTPASRQSATQQAAFLKEFLATQQQMNADGLCGPGIPVLPLPSVENNAIRVLVGPLPLQPSINTEVPVVPATGVTFADKATDNTCWSKLEESLVAEAQGSLPMIFKPTVQLFTNRTNNANKPTAIVGEPVNVCVSVQNPLHIDLPLRDVRLLWMFKTSEKAAQVDNEARSAEAENLVQTQCLESLVLKPDCTQEVVLHLTPRTVGALDIKGVAYCLANPIPQPPGEGGTSPSLVAIPGKQLFTVRGPRLKSTKDRPSQDTRDMRLELNVAPSAPCLQVTFHGLCSELLCGELQGVRLEFCNVGNAALTRVLVASPTPELFSLGKSRDPGQRITTIPFPGHSLAPGQTHSTPMWLRAPDHKGPASLDMLFYYENVNTNAIPRYRVVRHSWQLSVMSSVQVSTIAGRSCASSQVGTEEFLNFTMTVKNNNQVQDSLVTEVSLLQLSLVSDTWQLSDRVVIPQEVHLQPQEEVHLTFKAFKHINQSKHEGIFTDVPLSQDEGDQCNTISSSPYIEFYKRHVAKVSGNSHEKLRTDRTGQGWAKTSMADLEAALRVGAIAVLRWKAKVTNIDGKKREVVGQHHIAVEKVGVTSTSPLATSPGLQQELAGPLRIFGPEDISVQNSMSKYPALDVLQKLITYSIHHLSRITHDFKQSRICVIPVQLVLQNCSDSHLIVKVNTLGSSSYMPTINKNQLYSPHSSSLFRWVGLAGSCLELGPHGAESVSMAAALGGPGTYDLGARLEVWCRGQGAPEADLIAQTWRVESSLVCDTS